VKICRGASWELPTKGAAFAIKHPLAAGGIAIASIGWHRYQQIGRENPRPQEAVSCFPIEGDDDFQRLTASG